MSKCKKYYYEFYFDVNKYFSKCDNFSLIVESDVRFIEWCKEYNGLVADNKAKAKKQKVKLIKLLKDYSDGYNLVGVREYSDRDECMSDGDIDEYGIVKIVKNGKRLKVINDRKE